LINDIIIIVLFIYGIFSLSIGFTLIVSDHEKHEFLYMSIGNRMGDGIEVIVNLHNDFRCIFPITIKERKNVKKGIMPKMS